MTQRHNTTLDTHTVATLRAYGGGNLSQGIRRAAELVNVTEALKRRIEQRKEDKTND